MTSSSSFPKGKNGLPEHDPYEVLGISDDLVSAAQQPVSDDVITKAYRKKALKLHPDKNKNKGNNPKEMARLAEEFHKVKEARAFLLDPEHRTARQRYDAQRASQRQRQKADAARNSAMSDRRKRLRDELQRNEEHAKKTNKSSKSSSSSNKSKSKKSVQDDNELMENLKRESSNMRQKYAQKSAEQAANNQHHHEAKEKAKQQQEQRLLQDRQVRLKWSRKKMNTSPDEHTLATLLSEFGTVETVEMIGNKGNAAVLTFADPSSCRPCVEAYRTNDQMRAHFVGPRKEIEEANMAAAAAAALDADELPETTTTPTTTKSHQGTVRHNETLEQRQQRQAVERERLARQIMDQEDTVSAAASRCVKNIQLPVSDDGLTPIQRLQKAEIDILESLLSTEVFAKLKALHS